MCPVPEVTYSKLTESDRFIVLASDGVWEFMSSQVCVPCHLDHYHPPLYNAAA